MKILFILIIFIFSNIASANNLNFKKLADFKDPWGATFVDENHMLVTEKGGKIKLININNKNINIINHNLNFIEYGQGGLLDILFNKNFVYISYSEDRGNWKSSTSIARAIFNNKNLIFKNIFQANPPYRLWLSFWFKTCH